MQGTRLAAIGRGLLCLFPTEEPRGGCSYRLRCEPGDLRLSASQGYVVSISHEHLACAHHERSSLGTYCHSCLALCLPCRRSARTVERKIKSSMGAARKSP